MELQKLFVCRKTSPGWSCGSSCSRPASLDPYCITTIKILRLYIGYGVEHVEIHVHAKATQTHNSLTLRAWNEIAYCKRP